MPNAIKSDWEAIKMLVCAGTTYREAAEQFQITEAVIRKRASREKWPTPRAVREKARELMAIKRKAQDGQHQPIVPVSQRVTNELLTAKMAENWVEKGESHRALVFEMAHSALQKTSKRPPKLQDWQDIERADKMARRAAGLETNDVSRKFNVSLALVNERILALDATMPPDAPE
jgi:transposase